MDLAETVRQETASATARLCLTGHAHCRLENRLAVIVVFAVDYIVESNAVRLPFGTGTNHRPSNSSLGLERVGSDGLDGWKRARELKSREEVGAEAFSFATWDIRQYMTIKAFDCN